MRNIQELIGGIALALVGSLMVFAPRWIWRITEAWKTDGAERPSDTYKVLMRIVGGAMAAVGILLAVLTR